MNRVRLFALALCATLTLAPLFALADANENDDVPIPEIGAEFAGKVVQHHAHPLPLSVSPQYCARVPGIGGDNLAYDRSAATINPRLTEHSKKMVRSIYKCGERVYVAVGYDLANSIMVVGNDGVIIIDTVGSTDTAKRINDDFRKLSSLPVKAIVYTHNHTDHTLGTTSFVTEDQVRAGSVHIYAHDTLMKAIANNASVIGPIIERRSAYTYGAFLPPGPSGRVNQGIGPIQGKVYPGFIAPTTTFAKTLDVVEAGIKMHLFYAPSETNDEIGVWFPDLKVTDYAEIVQGESFPNLHTLRGTPYRDPYQWYQSVDILRSFPAQYLVGSHGRPFVGAAAIHSLLTDYRDAIQFTYDQTIRNINKGMTPDELVETIRLPDRLKKSPWLGEFYGTVKHSVRQIYYGNLGWFQGDATFLDPLPPLERARHYLDAFGGRNAAIKNAKAAFARHDDKWTAEVLTYVIRVNHNDWEARKLKAAALRRLGYAQTSINWRHFYLTGALELEGKTPKALGSEGSALTNASVMATVPIPKLLEGLAIRLNPVKSKDIDMAVGLQLTDLGEDYGVEIRGGVAEVLDALPQRPSAIVKMTKPEFIQIVLGKSTLEDAISRGAATVDGPPESIPEFFSYFDPNSHAIPSIVVR